MGMALVKVHVPLPHLQASGILYIGWQILLVIVSLSKICTGADGGWVVTMRQTANGEGTAGGAAGEGTDRSSAEKPAFGVPLPSGMGSTPIDAAFGTVGPPQPPLVDYPDSPMFLRAGAPKPAKDPDSKGSYHSALWGSGRRSPPLGDGGGGGRSSFGSFRFFKKRARFKNAADAADAAPPPRPSPLLMA